MSSVLKKSVFAIAALTASLVLFQSPSYAYGRDDLNGHWGIDGSVITDGTILMGVNRYAPNYEAGIAFGGKFDNSSTARNSFFRLPIFVGLRHFIAEHTVFAYGINGGSTFGRHNGAKINSDVTVGAYVSVEQYVSENVLLRVWIDPYQYENEKKDGVTTSTNSIFSAGGLGVTYLF
ncbi:MAG: hypothetical protein WCW01_03420 [Gammaproteobacteria bacterium]